MESKLHESNEDVSSTKKSTRQVIVDEQVLIRFGKDPSSDEDDPVASYYYDKYMDMSVQEGLDILAEAIKYHDDDVNFPQDVMDKIKIYVNDPQAFEGDQETFEREVKIEAVLIHYHSPYPEVRAVCDPYDDPTTPCDTFRAYFLGLLWTIIGTGVNQFFSPRLPNIRLSGGILQILLLPCGNLMALLPDWGFTIKGHRYSINPGPWTYKEQMFASIIFNVSIGGAYAALYNIITQKLPMFYDEQWASIGYQFLLVFSTQFVGFGFAGIMRRLIVYPVRAVWPTILPTLALNRALAAKEPNKVVNGWKISRYGFFLVTFSVSFIYYWLPTYLFEALSYFNWMTWISPNNFNLAAITGSISGLGLNPIPSFDWAVLNYNTPLEIPFYSQVNQYAGALIAGFCVIPALYWTNFKWTSYLPINSNHLFKNTGEPYDVRQILTNGLFDNEKYQKYSPPYYTAANLVLYGAYFALYPFAIIYTIVIDWKSIVFSIRDLWDTIKHPMRSNYESHDDPHSKMMSKYPEVPDWWFVAVMVSAVGLGIACVRAFPTNTPIWGIFFTIGINFVFLIPITLIYSVTGFSFGLNVLVELIVGYALPGNGTALNILKAYGYNIDGQAQNYITDQKMAHYAKLPPKAVFKGQMISTVIQVLVSVGVVNWQISNIDGLCTKHQAEKFTCPGPNTFYAASVIWGVIGPKRVFRHLYPLLQWCFLIGAVATIPFLLLRKFFPRQTKYFQPTLVIGGMLSYAPYNLTYQTGSLYLSIAFMWYIRRRYLSWWEKYTYVLSSSITAGVAFSAIIIFFAVQYHPKKLTWWGNSVSYAGADSAGGSLIKVPEGQIFGPPPGQFP
ncbi:uncharacterized protein SAPINGB_P003372 [Magnusiomyces paraingens]|uniref:OPT family small oligopeptide transporter n=1 Tax=Magnusiomyces paraingens TaxID=2606893 RepID=A0A5E8BUH6_9ASCO|nr:uncharacterized protein SAPINGB_P003372 [Saprochaete ingens]VVT53037.1 unnamed protein product [Saprochaete ingens]